MKILLLNPPGDDVYIRDYFCSKTTKSNYLFHPIDLVMLSGTLSTEHEVVVLDAIAERIDRAEARKRIDRLAPDVVVSLVGAVSWDEDRAFLGQIAEIARVFAIGDICQEDGVGLLEREPWCEGILHVFVNADLLHYLAGSLEAIEDMTVRGASGPERLQRLAPKRRRGEFAVARPRHELFQSDGYSFSFARSKNFATVLTDYGCPYPCTFCVIGTLGFQTRSVDEVLEEIDSLRARGTTELFVMDQTFGVKRERALELCRAFEERGDLSWTTFTRPDTADDELLAAMKAAGCHTVIMGVESGDDAVLAAYKKGYVVDEVTTGIRRAKRHGLEVVGTFVLGLPEETEDSLERTFDLALALELDYMSLNVAVPRFGTPFRSQALELGLCEEKDLVMDQAGAEAFLPTTTLDRERVLALKKRMIRRFYLRPGYLWRRLKGIRTPHQLVSQAREGWSLLRRNV